MRMLRVASRTASSRRPRRVMLRPSRLAALMTALVAGCTSLGTGAAPSGHDAPAASIPVVPLRVPAIAADTTREVVIAPGVTNRYYWQTSGPFAIHVLEVDRAACWTPAVLKPDTVAVGRAGTSTMLSRSGSADTVAAVNADFFLFAPPGVPTGAHVDDGRVITGPMARPALVVDGSQRVHFMRLYATGRAGAGVDTTTVTEWNRMPLTQLGAFDHRWGAAIDTGLGVARVAVGADGRVVGVHPGGVQVPIPSGGWVLVAARTAPSAVKDWVRARRNREAIRVETSLLPFHPHDAVGGFPMLAVDSMPAPALDSAHTQALGRVRHPRTAVGVGEGGRRLLLVVVDGRQPGYSAGMTLPELARLMLDLGARDALNLDGGGSSAMAVRDADGAVRVVNRPSDPTGERAVANALAVVRDLRPSPPSAATPAPCGPAGR